MRTREIPFLLRDGRQALLRSPEARDVQGLLDYLVKSSGETEFILRSPEECGKYTPESEAKWIENMNASANAAVLVCEVDGRIAGNCEITRSSALKTRHRANIGIALLEEFWGQRIGTAMFRELIHIAESWEGVAQLELEFIEGNSRARALYEKMGFRITGVRPDAIRLKNGELRNEYMMVRKATQ